MRLIRGSGGRGLAAIRPRRADGVIRPLLDCRRAAVAAVVARRRPARTASTRSNRDPRFLRTHVRERVLPLLAELNPAIAAACANLAAAARRRAGDRRGLGRRAARRRAAADGASTVAAPARGARRRCARCWCAAGWCAPVCRARGLAARHVARGGRSSPGATAGGAEAHLPRRLDACGAAPRRWRSSGATRPRATPRAASVREAVLRRCRRICAMLRFAMIFERLGVV